MCFCLREREKEGLKTTFKTTWDEGAENCIMKSFMSSFLDNIIRVIKSRRKKLAAFGKRRVEERCVQIVTEQT